MFPKSDRSCGGDQASRVQTVGTREQSGAHLNASAPHPSFVLSSTDSVPLCHSLQIHRTKGSSPLFPSLLKVAFLNY